MLEALPSAMLTEWMAYYEIEPFGEERADLRAGIVASTMANAIGGSRRTLEPVEFMPRFDQEQKPPMDEQAMKSTFRAIAKVWNAKQKGGRK